MTRFWIILVLLLIYTVYKATQLSPAHRVFAIGITLLIFVLMMGPHFLYRSQPELLDVMWFKILSWTGSVLLGIWTTFVLLSLPVDVFHLLSALLKPSFFQADRREFVFRSLQLGILGMTGGAAAIGLWEATRGPRVKKLAIKFPALPPTLQNLKIAQISDLHIGPTIRQSYISDVVAKTNATNPDLIFITGDLVDGKAEILEPYLDQLKHLKSRFGVFYVTGNHEYYWGAEALLEKIKGLGFKILLNENKILEILETRLMIAGVTDPAGENFLAGHKPDLQKANQSPRESDFKILLAHRPDTCIEAAPLGFHLQFSGHTHAGQFFPFSLLIPLAHKYYRGLNLCENMWVYVNPGTGYWGPANRFTVPSEITLVELLKA